MNNDLWQRVEDALDDRRDPFDDPRLAVDLERDPEALAAVRRLMSRLGQLSTEAPVEPAAPMTPTSERAPLLLTAASVLFIAGAGMLAILSRSTPEGDSSTTRVAQTVGPESTNAEQVGTALAPRRRPNVSLVVQTIHPEAARGARVVLEPRSVVAWNLEPR